MVPTVRVDQYCSLLAHTQLQTLGAIIEGRIDIWTTRRWRIQWFTDLMVWDGRNPAKLPDTISTTEDILDLEIAFQLWLRERLDVAICERHRSDPGPGA